MRLVDSEQMQEMDRYTIEVIGVPGIALMENAARSWCDKAIDYIDESSNVFVFCGGGNNGGDGYAIARNLTNRGIDCTVIAVKPPKSEDCLINASAWSHFGITLDWEQFLNSDFQINCDDIVVDAVLGTGLESEIKGSLVEVLEFINRQKGKKLAVDIASGISASTGDLMGVGIECDVTITFQKEKIGHHLYPGKAYSGETFCQNISIKEKYRDGSKEFHLLSCKIAKNLLPKRFPDGYKNKYGHVLSWCGEVGTLGASLLASHAALKSGTGLVTAAMPDQSLNSFLASAPELMSCRQSDLSQDFIKKFDAIALGCGLGRERKKWNDIIAILQKVDLPVVIDADAFYGITDWKSLNLEKTVLTPHPGEFEEMSGLPKAKTNKERISQGINYTSEIKTTLVLKGAPTLVFTQDGRIYISSTGNSGMSTAGSGDVLTGIIAGLLAQGLSTDAAALLGVWLHGKAGDLYVMQQTEQTLSATDLIDCLGNAYKALM